MKPRVNQDQPLQPRDVVVRAYEAANRAAYRTVAKCLSPEARRACIALTRATRKHLRIIERLGPQMPSPAMRSHAVDFVAQMRGVRRPPVEWCFASAVPPGTMRAIRITRQLIKGNKAVVSYAINWVDGETRRDREYLIKREGSWRITGERLR